MHSVIMTIKSTSAVMPLRNRQPSWHVTSQLVFYLNRAGKKRQQAAITMLGIINPASANSAELAFASTSPRSLIFTPLGSEFIKIADVGLLLL